LRVSSVFDELLSEVRDVAAPEHKLPNRSENSTTSSQVLGNALTVQVATRRCALISGSSQ